MSPVTNARTMTSARLLIPHERDIVLVHDAVASMIRLTDTIQHAGALT